MSPVAWVRPRLREVRKATAVAEQAHVASPVFFPSSPVPAFGSSKPDRPREAEEGGRGGLAAPIVAHVCTHDPGNPSRVYTRGPECVHTSIHVCGHMLALADSSLSSKDPVEMRRINFQTPDSGLSSPLREPGFHFESMLSHPPIPISDMAEHTERLKANDSLKLSQEYESIDPGQQFTWEHSNLEVNKPKNRYANVIAYDHSRVILQPIEGIVGSDYINANYVDGYRRQNAYIATQGPLPETFGDFWRMVWEQRSATIVMMTRLEEKSRIKCDQYWPNRGTETYGFIQVTLLDTIELATFCVRTFSLHKNGSSEKREVRQFQFTAWPDHGVPEYPTPFLAFLRRVKTCNAPGCRPRRGPLQRRGGPHGLLHRRHAGAPQAREDGGRV
ncbi:Receptor-type tyrosine-protein phosphatase S [Myotis davidii]|uniref:Receptor-type tyrosine-protein phosphatase S n=1 Tax=Myotis davidii TaxID=225400 RepID=L5LTS0_MYODS|nr:Receptor-type tyrosine-protein phosphatase S [Myotis davidii]